MESHCPFCRRELDGVHEEGCPFVRLVEEIDKIRPWIVEFLIAQYYGGAEESRRAELAVAGQVADAVLLDRHRRYGVYAVPAGNYSPQRAYLAALKEKDAEIERLKADLKLVKAHDAMLADKVEDLKPELDKTPATDPLLEKIINLLRPNHHAAAVHDGHPLCEWCGFVRAYDARKAGAVKP